MKATWHKDANTQRIDVDGSAHTFREEWHLQDKKGRVIGCAVTTGECDFVDYQSDEAHSYFAIPAGHYFWMQVSSTRGGVHYGAGQGRAYYTTREERDVAVERYRKGASRRALKQFGVAR